MAVLHRKEEKVQAVLGRLPKKYSPDDFVTMFIKLYSKDWGKIKSAYIKASQDKEPGTVIHMPKPELYLKQILEIFLTEKPITVVETPKEEAIEVKTVVTKVVKAKAATPVKKIEKEESVAAVKKPKIAVAKPEIKTAKNKAKDVEITKPKTRATTKKKVD